MKNIVIMGGGTAGWMTANLLQKKWRQRGIQISAIEPENKDLPAFKGNALAGLGKLSEGLKLRQKSFGFIRFDIAEGVSIVSD